MIRPSRMTSTPRMARKTESGACGGKTSLRVKNRETGWSVILPVVRPNKIAIIVTMTILTT